MRNWQENQVWTCVPFFSRSLLSLERCNITCSILFWQWGTLINLNQTLIILSTNFYHLFWEIGLIVSESFAPAGSDSFLICRNKAGLKDKLERNKKVSWLVNIIILYIVTNNEIWKYLSKKWVKEALLWWIYLQHNYYDVDSCIFA